MTRVMHRDFAQVAPDISVQELVDEHLLGSSQRAFPVVEDGRLLGTVCLQEVRKLDRERRTGTLVQEIMTPAAELHVLSSSDKASEALNRLAQRGINQLPVMENGRLLGMVMREDILKWLSLSRDTAQEDSDLLRGA